MITIRTHIATALLLFACYSAKSQNYIYAAGITSTKDADNIILEKATNTSGQLYLRFNNSDGTRRGYLGYAAPTGVGNTFFINNDDGSPTNVGQRLLVNGATDDNYCALLVNGDAGAIGFIARQQTGINGNRLFTLSDGLNRNRFSIGFTDIESGSNSGSNFAIYSYNDDGGFRATNFVINRVSGNVGIGTLTPGGYRLAVEGTIGARKVKVTQQAWADFVFDSAYILPTLKEIELHIRSHNHLPGIPSAKEIERQGLDVGEMQQKQMQKIEELTLYMIDLNKKLEIQHQLILDQQRVILDQGKELKELKNKGSRK